MTRWRSGFMLLWLFLLLVLAGWPAKPEAAPVPGWREAAVWDGPDCALPGPYTVAQVSRNAERGSPSSVSCGECNGKCSSAFHSCSASCRASYTPQARHSCYTLCEQSKSTCFDNCRNVWRCR